MANKIINIEDVSLKTMSVEIRAITVNNKQMTMGVFRQIPYNDILDYKTMELRGKPWGVVEYYWGDHNKADIHILWQAGNVLYRSLFSLQHSPRSVFNILSNRSLYETDRLIDVLRRELKEKESKVKKVKDKYKYIGHQWYTDLKKEDLDIELAETEDEYRKVNEILQKETNEREKLINQANAMHIKYKALIPQIKSLQQIFIAV